MAGRQTRRNVTGPHSALTDFLASHNISAAAIRNNYAQRLSDAQRQENAEANNAPNAENDENDENQDPDSDEQERPRKRKRKESAAAVAKAKAKAKAKRSGAADDDDDELLGDMMYQKSASLPGQLTNCDICNKRFTVTAYSKTGPDGGLLCAPCGKQFAADEKKSKPKARKPARKGRRQNFSNLLDGIAQRGAFSLLEMCIKKVADNINDIDEFGDLPHELLHRLSQILSKRRVITPRTLSLFLRSDFKSIAIYDCAKLEEEDFQKIFAFMPFLEKVNFRCAGQLKNKTLEYLMDRDSQIKRLHLDSCNLVSDECWQRYFQQHGSKLESLRLSNLDVSMGDESVEQIAKHCPNLCRLKLTDCWKPSDGSLTSISTLSKLEHLSLNFLEDTSLENLVTMLQNIGPNLQTLSLQGFKAANDEVLETLYFRCGQLSKLRFTNNSICTDNGFFRLFTNWQNPPLLVVDLSGSRHVDNTNPDGPEEPVGLASEGFKALMEHSGDKIQKLNISSCRHISYEAFQSVFNTNRWFPCLKEIDVSFHTRIDDFLMGTIFKCCPALTKVIAFACFNVRDIRIPPGVAMIGGVNAHHSINVDEEVL